jgi:hypothetical protein
VRPLDDPQVLELRIPGAAARALFRFSSVARRMFDLTADPVRIVLAFHR